MSLTGIFKGTGDSGFGWSSTAEEVVEGLDLSDLTILLTGANSGIGFETLRVLTDRGATVFAAARSQQKAEDTVEKIDGDAIPVVCELADPKSVLQCAEDVRSQDRPLDALICNAGIMALPKHETVLGYEKQFFVNHVGHFILVTELLEQLSDDGRVVVVASDAHKRGCPKGGIVLDDLSGESWYNGWRAYCHSKLANVLFARELGRRFEEQGSSRCAVAAHPGPIDTNLTRNMNPLARAGWSLLGPMFLKSIPEGAATQTWAAVHPDAADLNGEYLADCNVAETNQYGRDTELAKNLWEATEEIVDEVTSSTSQSADAVG